MEGMLRRDPEADASVMDVHERLQPEEEVKELQATPQRDLTVLRLSYSVDEAAHTLGIGRSLLYRLLKTKDLRAVKIGGRTLIPVREIEAYLARLGGVA